MNCKCSYLKDICTSELLRELDRRIDGRLEVRFRYFYDDEKVSVHLSGRDCERFSLVINQKWDVKTSAEYRKNYETYALNKKATNSEAERMAMDLIYQFKKNNQN